METTDMNFETRLRPNLAAVAAKVIDGEAIIMNLDNGLYFSMDGVGAEVWQLVELGCSAGEMMNALTHRYDAEEDGVRSDVAALLARLLEEGLVVEADGPSSDEAPPWGEPSGAYDSPRLNRYDDMADLLALDPPMPGLGDTSWEG